MTVTYVMEARENYTSDISSAFNTLFTCPSSQMYAGLSYDRVRRQIIYCCNVVPPTAVIGQPVTGNITNAGISYVPGFYPNEPFTGGTGTGGTADITVNGSGNISSVVIDASGSGYLVGDVLSARPSGGLGASFAFTLTAVSAGALNNTGHALWSGQTLIPNGSNYDGTLFKNHSTMVKSIDTDAVTRYDAWSSSATVPIGGGGGSPTSGTITNAGSGYNNDTYFFVPLTGGTGHGACAEITVAGNVVTAVVPSGGHGYLVGDVLSPLNTYMNGAGSGATWTVSAVTTGSDGTWRRVCASDAALVQDYSTLNVPRFVDPRTGNVWAHHQSDPPTSCEIYLLRTSDNFQQIISPLQPIPGGGIHMQPMALTANYLWVLNQQNGTGPSYLVGTPRTITAAETTADYLLPYPWYTWPYDDWASNNHPQWASRCCVDLSSNLYVLSWNYANTASTRTYTLQKFTEPSAASPYNTSVTGGGFTDITPWASTTGPNTGLPANGTVNNWLSNVVVTKTSLMYLPTANNLVAITKIFCVDLGQTWNSTNQANTHFDVTYIDLTHSTFDYHANWLTGYLDNSLNPTVLASASWALIDYEEIDTDLNIQSYDFTSTGVDYTKRWFFLLLSPVTGGVWSPPPGGVNDGTNRTCIIQVQFAPGSAPTILQTYFDTGWNTAYASFGTTIGNPNVVTATAMNTILSINFETLDSGVWDGTTQSWWWSGQTFDQFALNPAFAGRDVAGAGGAQPSPPFLRLSLGGAVAATGIGKTYMRIVKKKRGPPSVQRLAVGSAAGAGAAAARVQHASLAVGASAGAGGAAATAGSSATSVGSAVGSGGAIAYSSGAAAAIGTAAGAGAASATGQPAVSAVGTTVGHGTASAIAGGLVSAVGTAAGAGTASASSTTIGTTFTLVNFSASSSKCRYRRGLQFKKGDIPSGSVPVIKQGSTTITAQYDERVTWSDGSLKLCVLSLIDTDFAGLETRTYTVSSAVGAYNNTSLRTLADVTGSHDFKVTFSSVTQNNGSGPVTRGSGAFTADFNTQSGTATRVYKYHSGPVCTSWEVWGMATDNVGGAPDAHLKTVWYVTAWNNSDTTLNDVEYGAVVAQDWWNIPNKYLLAYNANLQDASTVINSYTAVSHPYQAQWMTVRTADDDNHARRFWANAIPTLYHTFDKNYARSTNVYPYLDPTYIPDSNATIGYTSSYVPLSAQDHRAVIDAGGGYPGRGLMSNMDCVAWMRQTSNDYRHARTNGFAGLHVGYHYKSNANRTISSGPQAGTDVANTTISMIMMQLFPPAYNFTAQGMPSPIDAYTLGGLTSAYVSYSGGTGVWTLGNDTSHAVAYSYGMYLLEGERHFMQATLELATNAVHQNYGNQYAGAPTALYYQIPPYQTLLSIPSTQYSAIGGARQEGGNYRNTGWGLMLQAQAAVVCPDADVQNGFIKLFYAQQTAYQVFNTTYFAAGQLAAGSFNAIVPGYVDSPWMGNFCVLGYAFGALACEDANALSVINNCLQYQCLNPWANGTAYRSKDYRDSVLLYTQSDYDPSTNPFLTPPNILEQVTVAISGNTITLVPNIVTPTVNDPVYFLTTNDGYNAVPVPIGAVEGTQYFVINPTATTFQLAATMGGSALTLSSGSYSIGWRPANWSVTPANSLGQPIVPGDDYPPISSAALVMASKAGATAITSAHLTNAANFVAPIDSSQWVTWKLTA